MFVCFFFCSQYSPDYVYLVKLMVQFSSIPSSFWNRLDFFLLATNDHDLPSIWVFSKSGNPSPVFMHIHEQHITFDVSLHNSLQRISFVCGSVWRNRRLHLWHDITSLSTNFSSSWCVLGDFNAVLGAHEKTGRAPALGPCTDFRSFIDDCLFSEVISHGAKFTWTNWRHGNARVDSKLDRALANFHFFDHWHNVSCSVLPRHYSDHAPLLLHCAL